MRKSYFDTFELVFSAKKKKKSERSSRKVNGFPERWLVGGKSLPSGVWFKYVALLMVAPNDFVSWDTNKAVASSTKDVNPRLAKRLLKTNGRLANLELSSLVKEATGNGLIIVSHNVHMKLCIQQELYLYHCIIVISLN